MKEITLTVSSKGQITLPVAARKKLGLRPGSRMVLGKLTADKMELQREKTIEDYFGKFKGVWTENGKYDPVSYIRELRDRE